MAASVFGGFPRETLEFLAGIAAHNDKAWFEAHRPLYEAGYVAPSLAFIETVGPRLQKISPGVQYAPRINGSLSRINRDIRFSKDKRPYKDHLDFWFWHGDKRGWACPGFYLRIRPGEVWIGVGAHQIPKDNLDRFRAAVIDEATGAGLVSQIGKVKSAGGYEVGGESRKQVPRGYPAGHPRAEYLLYEGLYADTELPAEIIKAADFVEVSLFHWRNMWPVGQWLLDNVG